MREFERMVLLRVVDVKWMDHIDAMEELRKGIGLRSYGQHDPVVEYRMEGFNMFDEMVEAIREDTTRLLLTLELRTEQPQPVQREQVAKPTSESAAATASEKKRPVRKAVKIGRNDPVPLRQRAEMEKMHLPAVPSGACRRAGGAKCAARAGPERPGRGEGRERAACQAPAAAAAAQMTSPPFAAGAGRMLFVPVFPFLKPLRAGPAGPPLVACIRAL